MPTPTTITITGGNGQYATINTQFAIDLVAVLRDEFGNPMAGQTVEFTPANGTSAPSGQFAGAFGPYFPDSVTTDGSGRATASHLTANSRSGSWSGVVNVPAFPAVQDFFSMTNTATGAPIAVSMSITANATQKAAKNSSYLAVTARVLDQFGAGFQGAQVTMTCPAGNGTFPGGFLSSVKFSDVNGYATFAVLTASSVLGTFNPSVSTPSIATQFCSFKTVDPSVVFSISVYSGQGQSAAPTFAFAQRLVGRAANELNGPVAGVVLTFDAPNSGASLVWDSPATDPTTAITDVNGLATSPGMTANATAGSYNVQLKYTGVTTRNFGLTNGGSPPAASDSSLNICEV